MAGAQAEWIPSPLGSDAGWEQPEGPTPMPKGGLSVLEVAFGLYWSPKVKGTILGVKHPDFNY